MLGLNPPLLTIAQADTYLKVLQTRQRMRVPLTTTDLLASDLGPWE